jgi:hypothetical protein
MQCSKLARLFDHFIGEREHLAGTSRTERLGGGQINYEIELGRLFDRNIGGHNLAQDFVDELRGMVESVRDVCSIRQ